MPRIGDKAPAFKAVTTPGDIAFPDQYAGHWVILFSHPADFTPGCTSCHDWFFCTKKIDKATVMGAIVKGAKAPSAPTRTRRSRWWASPAAADVRAATSSPPRRR